MPSSLRRIYCGYNVAIKENKEKGKIYAGRNWKEKSYDLEVRDKVYVKQMITDNKLSLNYDVSPHTVKRSEGSDVLVENDETGQVFRRT